MKPTAPLQKSSAIQSDDHNRGLQLDTATVRAIINVSPQLARVVLAVPNFDAEPLWQRPNAALRFYFDERFDSETRVYTVRSFNTADGTVDVDVVRHGSASPMMRWLDSLNVGDTVEFGGPRPHFVFPDAPGSELAIFADATSLPALYAILAAKQDEENAIPLRGQGWVATDDEVAFAELPQVPGITLTRVAPGNGFTAHFGSISEAEPVAVWAAGERDEMKAIRSHFRKDRGLAKSDVAVFGYWKRGTTNTQIDEYRLAAYEETLAAGGSVGDLDDLALAI
ncbi:siderophore-interacting protein [Leucobacter sp. 1207-22]|uniref:siderophore-interacting protein n=1 Tax=Leucobacter sp. 1207-22 TaxID=2604456 RepID=UPI0040634C2D